MAAKSLSAELNEQFQAALEDLDGAKQAMLDALGSLGRPTTPEKLAESSKAEDAMDAASAKCSQIAQKIAEPYCHSDSTKLASDDNGRFNHHDYQAYWREIVEPDYNEFNAKIDDLRRAFHCAITLFHMCDWVYIVHKPYIDPKFTYKDKNGVFRSVSDEKTFANAIRDLYPDFELIREIANSAKHLQLKQPGSHPSSSGLAANTRVQSTGWGQGGFGQGPFGGTARVMLQGPEGQDLEFSDIAASICRMWKAITQQHGWPL